VYETAYAAPVDLCCDEVVVDSAAPVVPQPSAPVSPPARSPKEVESGSIEDPTIPSYVDTPLPGERTKQRSTLPGDGTTKAQTKADTTRDNSPPVPPAAEAEKAAAGGDQGAAQKNAAAQKAGGTPAKTKAAPTAPADDNDNIDLRPAPSGEEALRRDSLRPVYPRMRSVDRRNILFGTVESEDGRPRGEVPVTVVSRNNSAIRHRGLTNAFGGYAIQVPDGQWSVRVTMPSGNMQTVRDITVTGGRIMDNLEAKEVHNLIITY
jgi:hypothetical protein